MFRILYRLARLCAGKRLAVAAFWLVIMLAVGFVATTGTEIAEGEFSIPGTESSEALESMERLFPSDSGHEAQTLQLVFYSESGSLTDPAMVETIESAIESARSVPNVLGVTSPFDSGGSGVSADGSVGIANVAVRAFGADQALVDEVMNGLESSIGPARSTGVTVEIGGSIGDPDIGISASEIVGAAIAFAVLVITLGSLAAAGANMLTALAGVVVGLMGVFAYSSFSPIEDSTPLLAMMLGLAVGIDYSLFILSRFRDELRAGRSVADAVPMAVGTAGSAVVFAGLTVIIALTGLAVVNIPPITEMGFAAAGVVGVAVAMSLTLMPVMLRTIGFRALSRRDRARLHAGEIRGTHAATGRTGVFARWANLVTTFPKQCLAITVAILAIVAIPFFSMDTALSVPGGSDPESSERRAYTLITEAFGAGSQTPLIVLVESDDAAATALTVSESISSLDHVAMVGDAQPNEANSAAIIPVISTGGPNDDSTANLVHDIRSVTGDVAAANVSVTGQTAIDIDINQKLNDALLVYIMLIAGLALVLLIVLFRSIVVPVVASLGFLLSLGASLGMTVAIFQWGWFGSLFGVEEGRPLQSVFPIVIVGILFGLAMDYQVFLVSKIHEAHVRGMSTRDAIHDGFSRSASIVVAAAAIMTSVFAGFALSGLDIVASLAFALAVGVLIDAFVVRMIVVPATLMLVGRMSWWLPRPLDRILPMIDTEGRTLERTSGRPGAVSGVHAGAAGDN
jgi:RND superfamily putative drug exporter